LLLLHFPGSGHLVYIGEVFPTSVRSKGQGVGSASHWFMNALIALEFPVVVHSFHTQTPFAFFAVMTVVQSPGGAVRLSGDQGQTLEALQRRLVPGD